MQEVLQMRLRYSVLFRHIEEKLEKRIKVIMQLAYQEAGKKKDKKKIICKPPRAPEADHSEKTAKPAYKNRGKPKGPPRRASRDQ